MECLQAQNARMQALGRFLSEVNALTLVAGAETEGRSSAAAAPERASTRQICCDAKCSGGAGDWGELKPRFLGAPRSRFGGGG
jgi:hypothetical protein